MLEINKIYNSDCIEGMKQINSGGGRFDSYRPSVFDFV